MRTLCEVHCKTCPVLFAVLIFVVVIVADVDPFAVVDLDVGGTENALRPCHELEADVVKTVFLHGELNGEVAEVVSLEVNVIEG